MPFRFQKDTQLFKLPSPKKLHTQEKDPSKIQTTN